MNCKICSHESKPIFKAKVINKYDVEYFKCVNCEFIQTEKVYWLAEAYQSAIAALDLGCATRNVMLSEIVSVILKYQFNEKGQYLDYGGGYGMFVRFMRDRGFNFYRQDIYCDNIFAGHFDLTNLKPDTKFEAVTAFEVFEHLDSPLEEIRGMFDYADSILFTTELQPKRPLNKASDWWYFVPDTGQHIAFYNEKSLRVIAEKFNCNVYSNGKNLHLLTRRNLKLNLVKYISYTFFALNKIFSRHFENKRSLLHSDVELVKSKILG